LSNDSPYKHKNIGRISEKNTLLKILDEDVKKSKISNRFSLIGEKGSSLPKLKNLN
jgi:hypothetical protein